VTGQKILEDALRFAAVDGYQVLSAVDYINAAVDAIITEYDEIGEIAEQEYNIDDINVSKWLALPDSFLAERRIYYKDTKPTLMLAGQEPYFFLIQNNKIRFDFCGDYIMEYLKVPDDINLLTEEPNVPKLYHRDIAYYLAYRIRLEIFGDEENSQDKFLAQFYNGIRKSNARLINRKRRRFTKAPVWGG